MSLVKQKQRLTVSDSGSIVFILDASESAENQQETIISLTRETIDRLPIRLERQIFFLGNPTPYNPHSFFEAPHWFAENRRRASLISPVWEHNRFANDARFVVIGSGSIFDLEDWADTFPISQTLLVSLGDSLQDGHACAPEMHQPLAPELFQRIHDPVTQVKISGPGFMPLQWDNIGYQLDLSGGQAMLVGTSRDDFQIALEFFVLEGQDIQAKMIRESGQESTVPLEMAAQLESKHRQIQLSAAEKDIFSVAIQKQNFACHHCGGSHPWDQLKCRGDGRSISGVPIYESLDQQNARGFVCFRSSGAQVTAIIMQSETLELATGQLAVKDGSQLTIYEFDPHRHCWLKTERPFTPYHQIPGGDYAIFL